MEIDKSVYRLNVFRLISVISKRRYLKNNNCYTEKKQSQSIIKVVYP